VEPSTSPSPSCSDDWRRRPNSLRFGELTEILKELSGEASGEIGFVHHDRLHRSMCNFRQGPGFCHRRLMAVLQGDELRGKSHHALAVGRRCVEAVLHGDNVDTEFGQVAEQLDQLSCTTPESIQLPAHHRFDLS
jgi:hypothetical protein